MRFFIGMGLSQVKLVVSDMDGTLLNSKDEVSKRFFELHNKLSNLGIQFIAASGRQYYSIIDKLASIQNDIYVVAENGALTMHQGTELETVTLERKDYISILDIAKNINDATVVLCARNQGYVQTKNSEFIDFLKEYYVRYEVVEDLYKVTHDPYLKVAIHHPKSSEKHLLPKFNTLQDRIKVKVSAKVWLDLSNPEAHKGNAIQKLQDRLGISKEETMVFGDYNNDLEMLAQAKYSYAMGNAHPNVKKAANFQTESNDNFGVERVLEELVRAKAP
ncbi:HAD family hydrolase [Aquimarina sp. ERC-38]|uniref:HAD family hydrolase n=1 Tax=Aquimarina sp. ERC-38 TaxID=2949996 RepID=UPI002246C1B9|nr:HAD family hydrolase [Aquimarina sp. ERC-38]UZO82082.1 HAD family hydrolase [Aquimarina sp. ERC-38]